MLLEIGFEVLLVEGMFSSSIARLNLLTSSRCSREPTSCTFVRACFHRFPRSIVIFHDAIVFIFHKFSRSIWRTKFSLQLTNNLLGHRFPFRSSIGLGNWVGLEEPAWIACPSDCWTSFPTGWCSTVEPDWSFPLVQLWSCFKEIFGGGRRDKYCLSYNFSPVFNLSTFTIQWAGSVPWRIIAFDLVW